MIIILVSIILTFLSYYFACFISISSKQQFIFVTSFIICSIFLRIIINVNLNNDYYYYYDFGIFHKPDGFLSYILNEPYLYSIYAFFTLFITEKREVFLALYWFNFSIITFFFIWLLYRKDVEMWKKMILFVVHYFFFCYTFLRNGPAYILFSMYLYYVFRDKKFNWVLITPFMHISSCLMLVLYFHKWRNYFKMLLLCPVVLIFLFLILKPLLTTVPAFESILSKIHIYSQRMPVIGVMHVLFFLFVSILVVLGFLFYKSKMLHPILVTTILFYGITFFINPIVAHRFSPYVIFALLLFPFEKTRNERNVILVNQLSILLFPIFVYTLFNTHRPEFFIDVFMR